MAIIKPARAQHGRTWCGPYALALISNTTYEVMYNRVKGILKRSVRGMYSREVEYVLKKLGCVTIFVFPRIKDRTTLRRSQDYLKPNRLYIVWLTSHYAVVNTRDWTVTDNQILSWEPINASALGRKKLFGYAEVRRIEE